MNHYKLLISVANKIDAFECIKVWKVFCWQIITLTVEWAAQDGVKQAMLYKGQQKCNRKYRTEWAGIQCKFYIQRWDAKPMYHFNDIIISAMASRITSLTIVYSTIHSGEDQRKHQSPASLAFVRRIHRWLVNSPHKGPVTRKTFPFDDVLMWVYVFSWCWRQACIDKHPVVSDPRVSIGTGWTQLLCVLVQSVLG